MMKRPPPQNPIVVHRRAPPLRVPSESLVCPGCGMVHEGSTCIVEVLEVPRPAFFAAELDAEETKRSTLRVFPWPQRRAIVIDRTPGLDFDVQLAPAEDGTLYVRISARGK